MASTLIDSKNARGAALSAATVSAEDSNKLAIVEKEHVGQANGTDTVHDAKKGHTAQEAAMRGQAATDSHGHSLVTFDKAAEARLRWKIDLCVMPTVSLIYLFCFIDRANIGNAKLAGLEKSLGLAGYDYNTVLSTFYISYIIFEIPCNIACKWIGPGWFLPASSLGFGILTVCFAFVQNKAQACAVRFLLGIFEAGILPGIAYYLSRWYRRDELTFRLAIYTAMAPLAGAFGGLLASAILKLPNFGSTKSWEMIFAIEGIISVGVSIIAFLTLTDRPATAIWLTEDEKAMAIARVKSERVGTTEVLDKIDSKKTILGMRSPVTLATAWMFLLVNITVQGFAFFAPTIVATIYPTSSVITQQLYTVPPWTAGSVVCLFVNYLSWKFDRRNLFIMISAPLIMAGYIMFLATTDSNIRYGGTFLIASGSFTFASLCASQVSANVVSDTARSSAIGTNVMFGNIGGLISTWAFLPFDAPNFHIGNGLNLATSSCIFITSIILGFWMKADNAKRENKDIDAELEGLNQGEIQDMDWRHPAFRWRP